MPALVTVELAAKIVMTLWNKYERWKQAKEARAAEAAEIAEQVATVYDQVRDGLGDVVALISEWRSGVRSLHDVLLPLRARIDLVTEQVGRNSPRLADRDRREWVIAAVLAQALHEATHDDDLIPLIDDTEAIRIAINEATRLWRAGRDAGSVAP